jgi:putative ABC transport system permease protein
VGLVSSNVGMRVPEIGIRLALGGQPADIWRLVLADALRWLALGAAAGTLLALWLTRLVSGLLHDVAPTDFAVFAGTLTLLAACSLIAIFVPARRATRLDPIIALRGRTARSH